MWNFKKNDVNFVFQMIYPTQYSIKLEIVFIKHHDTNRTYMLSSKDNTR